MANVASLRLLIAGSGLVSAINIAAGRPARLVFTVPQNFKRGDTVALLTGSPDPDNYLRYTIGGGAGTEWVSAEPLQNALTSVSFRRTDQSANRARGIDATAKWVPRALHFFYISVVDQAGLPDAYSYIDTVFPENGLHPYTRDPWTGLSWLADFTAQTQPGNPVSDLANRVAALDLKPPVLSR